MVPFGCAPSTKSTIRSAGTPLHTLAAFAALQTFMTVNAGAMCTPTVRPCSGLVMPYSLQWYAGNYLYDKGTSLPFAFCTIQSQSQMKPGFEHAAPLQARCLTLIPFQIC